MAKILLADDTRAHREIESDILKEDAGHTVVQAANGEEALARFQAEGPFDLLIIDYDMGSGPNGIEVAEQVLQHWPGQLIIIASANWRIHSLLAEKNLKVASVMGKPFSDTELIAEVRRLLPQ